jgi:hypothetical protein
MAEKKSGSFKIFNNQGSFTVPVDSDQLTDGQKSLQVQIRTISTKGPIIGTLSSPITVNDTSFTPVGTLIRSECRGVDKWGIYANGSGGTYNQLIQQNSVDCGYTPPPGNPSYGTILSQGCVPGTYTYRIVKADGNGGSFNEDTVNSVQCGYTPPTETYYIFTSSVNEVNEGQTFTISFSTNLTGAFGPGSPAYTITGVTSADIGGAPLKGFIGNGNVLTFNVTADNVTDGRKTFTISLDNGKASKSVIINDTSLSPVTTRSVNWSPSNGSLILFVANGNFIGWIGDITKSNIQIDNTERNSIIYDPTMRQKITELIQYMQTQFGVTIDESNIDAELNRGIDSYNSIINEALGNNTAGVYLLAETPKLTNQNSFDIGDKRYTRTTLKYSAVDFGYRNDIDVDGAAEELTTALVTELNNNGILVNASQRTQIKNLIIAVLQLLSNTLNSITDKVDLYDYTEQLI